MQVGTTAHQSSRGLLAVGPDMAKVLALTAQHEGSLTLLELYRDDIMLKAIQL
jgi:hypothetical protein